MAAGDTFLTGSPSPAEQEEKAIERHRQRDQEEPGRPLHQRTPSPAGRSTATPETRWPNSNRVTVAAPGQTVYTGSTSDSTMSGAGFLMYASAPATGFAFPAWGLRS
jgi:hypothetical protein